jgi:hypothetical protein
VLFIFRSSVAAFYAQFLRLFYRLANWGRRGVLGFRLLLHVCSEVKEIVHWVAEVLFAAQVALRCLYRCVTEQELNLFDLATVAVAKLRTGSS